MSRTKKLPILPSLSVVLTGCADPISGDWTAVKGGDHTFPYTLENCWGSDYYYDYEYSYAGREYCYSYSVDMWMSIDDDMSGTLVAILGYSYDSYSYEDAELSDIAVQKGEDSKYTLYSESFVLDCQMSDNVTLKCDVDELNNDDNPDMDLSPVTFSKSNGKD